MSKYNYETHFTVEDSGPYSAGLLIKEMGLKPVAFDLIRDGKIVDRHVMGTNRQLADSYEDVLATNLEILLHFSNIGLKVLRTKIETTNNHPAQKYFYHEIHATVKPNKSQSEKLLETGYHVSRNVDKADEFVITVRDSNLQYCSGYFDSVNKFLTDNQIEVINFEAEKCLFDSNQPLDDLWFFG